MVISARVHYAALALLELALHKDDSSPLSIREISDRHGVPGPFLVQILRALRTAGWVSSVRGPQGGYRLAVEPSAITLLDIAEAVGCSEANRVESDQTPASEMLQQSWDQAAEASREVLAAARLSDLVERCRHGDETMFYI